MDVKGIIVMYVLINNYIFKSHSSSDESLKLVTSFISGSESLSNSLSDDSNISSVFLFFSKDQVDIIKSL